MSFRIRSGGETIGGMGLRRAGELLALPVRHNGIELGRAVDILLDVAAGRAIGIEVRCGDETRRFLPLGAARLGPETTEAVSPLALLDDLAFYRARGTGLRELRGASVQRGARTLGALADVVLDPSGAVEAVLVETASGVSRVRFAPGITLVRARDTAA